MLHRDDVPMDVLESLEKQLKEIHPNMKLVCAGDLPEGAIPPHIAEVVQEMETGMAESIANGTCVKCKRVIPGWPFDPKEADLPDGWALYVDMQEKPVHLQCGECQAAENPLPPDIQNAFDLLKRAGVSQNTINAIPAPDGLACALSVVGDMVGDVAPDDTWFREYYELTGKHYVLTEEGWVPAWANSFEHTGAAPMDVLDEVNAGEDDE